MTAATIARAEFLKSAERQASAVDAAITARWGDDAADTSQSTCLTVKADAVAEAARQLALLTSARAIDVAIVRGIFFDLEGQTVALPYSGRLGIAGTALMLVTRCKPQLATGMTEIEGQVVL